MPEGHTIHRLARDHTPLLVGRPVRMTSPQGRFATGAELLSGRVCERIEPWGKHLWYAFEGDALLHVHLGLYGKWAVGEGDPPEVRGALRLRMRAGEDGDDVPGSAVWLDLRGPTACEVVTPHDRDLVVARLGPDPLRRDARPDAAWDRLSRTRRAVGELLMDQSVLAGVGNVYRAEALFRARMSPFRAGRDVGRPEWERMWEDLRVLLRSGVRAGRIVTTEAAHRSRRSGRARREDAHYVYRRHGLPCRVCDTEVLTRVVAGRNLFWCPSCQAA